MAACTASAIVNTFAISCLVSRVIIVRESFRIGVFFEELCRFFLNYIFKILPAPAAAVNKLRQYLLYGATFSGIIAL